MSEVAIEQVYDIIGVYRRKEEIIDSAQNKEEADDLVVEYKLAFGKEWRIFSRIQR